MKRWKQTIRKATFEALREIIYEKSGISLTDRKESLVAARVNKRLRVLGLSDYESYIQFLNNDSSGKELILLLDVISTNVTSFFREEDHFIYLEEQFRTWLEEGKRHFRVWCAAASSGEEPYTIAMTIHRLLESEKIDADVRILATDISTHVLGKAVRGIYEEKKLEGLSRDLLARYFREVACERGPCFQVSDELRRMILFKRLNLSLSPFPLTGPLDIVFCRNVMIYFDQRIRQQLVLEVERLLRSGGVLFTGHAESLTGVATALKVLRPSVYQKK